MRASFESSGNSGRITSAPKTAAGIRRVVLMPEVARILRAHKMASPYKRDDDFVFPANEELRAKLAEEAGADAGEIDFLPLADLDERVRASVRRIEDTPLLPTSFPASGFLYDVQSGRLREIS